MYHEAKNPDIPSNWVAFFVNYFMIEIYRIELNPKFESIFSNKIPWRKVEEDPSYRERALEFARWLWENRNNPNNPEGYRESGRYFWHQWEMGASFEAINWYREKRNEFRTHSYFATEFPCDDVECFMAAGNLIFNKYCVDAMQSKMKKARLSAIRTPRSMKRRSRYD